MLLCNNQCLLFLCLSDFLPKPSIQRKVNLLSIYDEEKPVAAFKKEAAALSHSTSMESGSDHDED